jgi:hypothetical protein
VSEGQAFFSNVATPIRQPAVYANRNTRCALHLAILKLVSKQVSNRREYSNMLSLPPLYPLGVIYVLLFLSFDVIK